MRLPPSVTHHLSPRFPPIRHPAHAETSQRYVTRRLFLLLFRGGKNLKELSGQIAPIPRLLIPKSALRWAAGHLMSDGRTPAPTLTVGFLQAVGDASPHPGLPADPDLSLCCAHSMSVTVPGKTLPEGFYGDAGRQRAC